MPLYPRRWLACASFVLISVALRAHAPAVDMLDAANGFLNALSPEQKSKATYALTDDERENWNFVPTARNGVPLGDLSPAQHELALALLRSGLSHAGFARADAIRSLEEVLKSIENGSGPRRDPERYFVTIFGEPSATKSWGWRFEGHHVSFNFTVVDGAHVFFTPSFLGSNPADVRTGPKQGLRVLGDEDDAGRALIKSLDDDQRKIAIIAPKANREIVTGNSKRVSPLSPEGISAKQLTPAQRDQLATLVKIYLGRWRAELFDQKWAEIEAAGIDNLSFAWAGGLERGEGNYYRIQGPTFLIEFDNTQNHANHIHTVFRDFKNDFGYTSLAEHYAKDHAR
jgi:hypothetical protein